MTETKPLLGGVELGGLDLDELTGDIDRYVVSPGLGSLAGPLGALALAADAL
jgi:hypothetical protein